VNNSDTKDIHDINVNIFSDRVNCQFCQEVMFRANRPEEDYPTEYQIVGGIKKSRINIKTAKAEGFPLYLGESINQENIVGPTRVFIKDLLSSNSARQRQICQPFRR
jgi:hypothetical protein